MRRAFFALVAMCLSCATAARLHTNPEGALVYVDGLLVGETPAIYHNERGLPQRYHVQIFKEGYAPVDTYVDARLSYVWGFLGAVTLLPYLWGWALQGDHTFTLTPESFGDKEHL